MTNSVFVNTQGLYQRRRAFNMSYRNDFETSLGVLVPVYWQDLMPNTSWSCRVHGLVRFMPLIAPIMDNIDLYVHFWQAPERILYGEEFTDMITGESEDWPGIYFTCKDVWDEAHEYIYNKLPSEDPERRGARIRAIFGYGGIFDMLGYDAHMFGFDQEPLTPTPYISEGKLNARKFCMYIRLIRDWYTNENVEPYEGFFDATEVFDKLNFLDYIQDGNISSDIAEICVNFNIQYNTGGFATHLWPKDYFTSALPTLQYGLPTYLPLADTAPVTIGQRNPEGNINKISIQAASPQGLQGTIGPQDQGTDRALKFYAAGSNGVGVIQNIDDEPLTNITANLGVGTNIQGTADLSEATAITINELRVANALQVFKEREMRYGRKAPEYYKGFYGVTPGDLRLQLPKFLGGGKLAVNISDVEQTSANSVLPGTQDEVSPQGNLSGKGTGLAAGFAKARTFVAEESSVIGLAWLMPKVTYSAALSRHDTKLNDRFDYYNPSFAHIGEQPVYNYEVYGASYGTDDGNKEFGYQPRYTEYRFHMNEQHGQFKKTLSFWTLGRIFHSQPALNADFVYMQPMALQRIFARQTSSTGEMINNVLCSFFFSAAVIQPLSRYGTPGLMP